MAARGMGSWDEKYDLDCWSCQNLMGTRRLTRAPRIYQGKHWIIEHAAETSIAGWIVIVLRRHAVALHELDDAEFEELNLLVRDCCRILHSRFSSVKEYVMQFAEAEHFDHVHFHLVPKLRNWPKELRGPGVFAALGEDTENPLSAEQITEAVHAIRSALAARTDT